MRYGGALVMAFVGCFGDSSVVFGLLDVERADLRPCYHRQDSGVCL